MGEKKEEKKEKHANNGPHSHTHKLFMNLEKTITAKYILVKL